MIHDQFSAAQCEVVGEVQDGIAVRGDGTGEILAGRQSDVGVPVDESGLTIGIAIGRSDLDAVGTREDVLKGVEADPHRSLVAATAEAVDPVGGGTEGRGEIDLIVDSAGHRAEPEPLDRTGLIQGRLHRPHVESAILPGIVEGDDAEVRSGRRQLDLPVRGRASGKTSEDVRLGQPGSVVVVGEGDTGERPLVAGGGDFLVGDVGDVSEADDGPRHQIDVTHTKGRAGERGADNRTGGGVLGGGPDVEADLAIGAEGVGAIGKGESAVADLDELAVGTADDLTFENGLVGGTEGGTDDGAVRAQGGGSPDGDALLGEVEVDGRIRTQIRNREIVDPLHDALVVVRDGGVGIDSDVAA